LFYRITQYALFSAKPSREGNAIWDLEVKLDQKVDLPNGSGMTHRAVPGGDCEISGALRIQDE
jgi:hypothetical protein